MLFPNWKKKEPEKNLRDSTIDMLTELQNHYEPKGKYFLTEEEKHPDSSVGNFVNQHNYYYKLYQKEDKGRYPLVSKCLAEINANPAMSDQDILQKLRELRKANETHTHSVNTKIKQDNKLAEYGNGVKLHFNLGELDTKVKKHLVKHDFARESTIKLLDTYLKSLPPLFDKTAKESFKTNKQKAQKLKEELEKGNKLDDAAIITKLEDLKNDVSGKLKDKLLPGHISKLREIKDISEQKKPKNPEMEHTESGSATQKKYG